MMDRDAAIGSNGAKLAKKIMENERVMSTDAYKSATLSSWSIGEPGIPQKEGLLLLELCCRIWKRYCRNSKGEESGACQQEAGERNERTAV